MTAEDIRANESQRLEFELHYCLRLSHGQTPRPGGHSTDPRRRLPGHGRARIPDTPLTSPWRDGYITFAPSLAPGPPAFSAADLPYRSYETVEMAVRERPTFCVLQRRRGHQSRGRPLSSPAGQSDPRRRHPFSGDLGMLPQRVLEEGGYHIKGKKESEQQASWTTLKRSLPPALSRWCSNSSPPRWRGPSPSAFPSTRLALSRSRLRRQILVTPDLLGMLPWFSLKHVKPKLNDRRPDARGRPRMERGYSRGRR